MSIQQLINEYQTKIQQQNRQIEILMKEVKSQKFIIDTFANPNDETIDITTQSKNADKNSKIETDSEPEAILYTNIETKHSSHENAKGKSVNSLHTETMMHRIDRSEIERKKTSVVSIKIHPNIQRKIQNLTNIYICDECNKKMSSRRVLAVCISELIFLFLRIQISICVSPSIRNTSEWSIVHKKNLYVTIVRKHFVSRMA